LVAVILCCGVFLLLTANANAAALPKTCIIWRIHSELKPAKITCHDYETGIYFKFDSTSKAAFDKLAVGTIIEVPVGNDATSATDAASIKIARAKVGSLQFAEALVAGSAAAVLFACLVAGGGPASIRSLLVGMDGRYSNSKVQATAWMGIIFIAFTGTCVLRLIGNMNWSDATNIGIPPNLLSMAAVSAATAGGAKIVTGSREATKNKLGSDQDQNKTTSLLDLFRNDSGGRDIGDAQMILVTLASIVLFAVNVGTRWKNLPLATHVDLPDASNALTYAFGGSMGGYLAKKIGGSVIQ
jgi:hypothetical protein